MNLKTAIRKTRKVVMSTPACSGEIYYFQITKVEALEQFKQFLGWSLEEMAGNVGYGVYVEDPNGSQEVLKICIS
jgi:hypothetical protein